jgi:4-hydroxybenzoate polyprenyltransferase
MNFSFISFFVGLIIALFYFFLLKKSFIWIQKRNLFIVAWAVRYGLVLGSLIILQLFQVLLIFWWLLGFGVGAVYSIKDDIRIQDESSF